MTTFLNFVRCPECERLSLDRQGHCHFACSICGESTEGNCIDGHCDRDSCRASAQASIEEGRGYW